jgi:tetratricopeptide (TPR) repeat protein
LAAYLSIWLALFLTIIRLRRKDEINHYQAILLLGVLVAYFVHNLLVFDSISTLLSFVFLLAFVYYLGQPAKELEEKYQPKKYLAALPILALILLLVVSAKINIPLNQSARDSREVIQQFEYKNYADTVVYDRLDASLSRNLPWDWELIDNYTKPILDVIREPGAPVDFDRALESVKNLGEVILTTDSPELLDAKIYERFARIYTLLVEISPSDYYKEQAQYYLDASLELSPERLPTMYVLAQLKAFEGDYDGAAAVLDQAIAINPDIAQTYWSYALIYSVREEDQDKMFAYIRQAVDKKMTFTSVAYIENILPIFQQEPVDYESLEYLYLQAINIDRQNPQWYASLAAVYANQGQKQKAIDTVKKILEIDPAYEEQVIEFLSSLE